MKLLQKNKMSRERTEPIEAYPHLPVVKGSGEDQSLSHTGIPVYNVINHNLVGDGVTLNTESFQKLINKVSKRGGGTILFPAGNFLSGTFQLKDNVNLYLSPGATIWGSINEVDYRNGCLVYAENAKNVSITGTGVIDGNGKSFWEKRMNNGEEKWAVRSWRPNRLFLFIQCQNLSLHNFTIKNSPAWTIHPIDCDRVTITGISILNGIYEDDGPNTDGINPDGCSNVFISNCCLLCGDDCIVLKITEKSQTKICSNIVVTNCVLQTSQTGLKIGTETHGEFRNITFSNCTVFDSGSGFGLIMRDGGLIDGVVVKNIAVHSTHPKQLDGQGIYIWSHRRNEDTPFGMIKNVLISNMTISAAGGIFITGAREKHIDGLTLENIRIKISGGRYTNEHDNPSDPFTVFGHFVAPYDIFCRYVDNLKLQNIQISWPVSEDQRFGSALRCWSAKNVDVDGFKGRQSLNSNAPAISFKNVDGGFIHNCVAPEGTGTVLEVENSESVSVIGNEFSRARELYKAGRTENSSFFETGNRLPK